MMTLDMSFADMVSPDTVTMLGHPQLAVLPVCADTSFPQDLHLTLIDSITLILFVCTQSNHQLLYKKVPSLYLMKKG